MLIHTPNLIQSSIASPSLSSNSQLIFRLNVSPAEVSPASSGTIVRASIVHQDLELDLNKNLSSFLTTENPYHALVFAHPIDSCESSPVKLTLAENTLPSNVILLAASLYLLVNSPLTPISLRLGCSFAV